MDGLGLNLFSEALGVAAELLIVYFIVNYLLDKKEEQKWSPARRIIVKYVAKSYESIFHASEHILNFDYKNLPNRSGDDFQGRSVYLEYAVKDYQKMQRSVEISNAAMNSTLMPVVSEFNDLGEIVINKLNYYMQMHHKDHATKDFVAIPPLPELCRIEELMDSLKKEYSKIFEEIISLQARIKTFSEIERIWKDTAKETKRLFFEPNTYKCDGTRTPLIYDHENLRKISSKNIKDGAHVSVFKR